MTTTAPAPGRSRPPRSARGGIGLLLGMLLTVSATLTATLLWADHYVFDAKRFSARAEHVLDSPVVRSQIADQFTRALVANGPSQIASFQNVLRPVVETMIQTDAFRNIFRNAVADGHDYLFTRHGNAAIINLSQSLGILSASLQISNPSVAASLPADTDRFLVDFGDNIRGLELWRISRTVSDLGWVFLVVTGALAVGTVVIDPDRRRGILRLGIAVAVTGGLMFTIAAVVPAIAGSYATTAALDAAIHSATDVFMADYRVGAIWLIGIGIAVAAFATASAPRTAPLTTRDLVVDLQRRVRERIPDTSRVRAIGALGLIAVGLFFVLERDFALQLTGLVIGAVLLYLGSVRFLAVVGRTDSVSVRADLAGDIRRHRWSGPSIRIALVAVIVLALLLGGAFVFTERARSRSEALQERRCNGHAELCARTIDQVAFAGSHNSMSASDDPGWLFAENVHGIPAQLEYGIRALMVKTHYGIPSGITIGGAPLVVTDRVAELEANPAAVEEQLPDGVQPSTRLSAARNVDPALRDVYLCHVYCEYGALRFRTALGYIRQFLARNPNNVILLVVGDYVSRADTEKAFRAEKMFDRLWSYDPNAPMPTLGDLIDTRRNVVLMSEFTGQPPAWNLSAYRNAGVIQDTPFTFHTPNELLTPGSPKYTGTATVDGAVPDTVVAPDGTATFAPEWSGLPSCAPNRGTPESPLFQINHWVTPAGSAPTVAQARIVNAWDVLMPRVRDCRTQRGHLPNIIGVNFYDVGNLMAVVDTVNGFDRTPPALTPAEADAELEAQIDAGITDTTLAPADPTMPTTDPTAGSEGAPSGQ